MIKIRTLENECNSINKLHELQTPFSLLSYYSKVTYIYTREVLNEFKMNLSRPPSISRANILFES